MSSAIQTAAIDWQTDPLGEIPVSRQFGDVYFSRANGLAETRHVFLEGNDLSPRLASLADQGYFVVGETGFGTGLNVLALWQLWQQVRPNNHSRLHVVSVEKYPLTRADLTRALAIWPELAELSTQLLQQYPPPLAGVHRMIFAEERFSIDLWLGDAADCLPKIHTQHRFDAWFLDGFAPACNPELWQNDILSQIVRLSGIGTTFASFSVAGVVKQGLRAHGITVTRPKGFGRKREMLKAYWAAAPSATPETQPRPAPLMSADATDSASHTPITIIGAGIAGLSCAYALLQRGYVVRLIDAIAPLAGASGNPRALLMPKLTPLSHVSEHLHTLGWLSTIRWWSVWQQQQPVIEATCGLSLSTDKQPIAFERLADYPDTLVQAQSAQQTSQQAGAKLKHTGLFLPDAALLNPAALAQVVLTHPKLAFQRASITALQPSTTGGWQLLSDTPITDAFSTQVIVTAARQANKLCPSLPRLAAIRGQISMCDAPPNAPTLPLSYGGYCTTIQQAGGMQLLFGASFIRQDDLDDLRLEDHQHNQQLLAEVLPSVAMALPPMTTWQGRAAIRAQMSDYLPLVGRVPDMHGVWVLAGLGSKGFAFAPLCAELLVAELLGEVWPVSSTLGHKLRAART